RRTPNIITTTQIAFISFDGHVVTSQQTMQTYLYEFQTAPYYDMQTADFSTEVERFPILICRMVLVTREHVGEILELRFILCLVHRNLKMVETVIEYFMIIIIIIFS
ncbi:Hypothetical predicted protein, partial [Olea europaea subsp. europaea]